MRVFQQLKLSALLCLSILGPLVTATLNAQESPLPEGIRFVEKLPVNGLTIHVGERSLAMYRPASNAESDKTPVAIFLTHARRDLTTGARPLVKDTRIFVPAIPEGTEEMAEIFTKPQIHWKAWWEKRFDYYGQQVTRVPVRRLPPSGVVKDGDHIELSGESIEVMATPGVTREGVTYLIERGGKRIAFSGNLILEGGRVPDLYSFQEAIVDAKVGAYHGYAGRFGPWIESLEKLAAKKPDVIVPSQGPLITDPQADIAKAIERARAIYANYLSTNALHWYFGEERMRTCADKVLGSDAPMESMPMAEHIDLPAWVQHIGTTKLLVSKDKVGFALDVGSPNALKTLQEAVANGLVTKIEGIWVTHRHNDHTQAVRDAQEALGCPVYAIESVAEALTNPGAHFSPGISANAVKDVKVVADGETMAWREFDFTFRFFPGQMLDHGAMLVQPKEKTSDPIFFIGDSFSPSGIDDYCLMNRNLMREDSGYLKCFQIVREELPENSWLVNQHIPHLFRFTDKELDHLETRYRERIAMIAEFTPWDDPNYAIDEQWAWLFPYGQEVKRGEKFTVTLRVMNHSKIDREFRVRSHFPKSLIQMKATLPSLKIAARESGELTMEGRALEDAALGVQMITLSLSSDGLDLPHWCEAMVKVVK
ncbi:MAG: MBL fold metallo-hydrolase [Verrucomicrobiae bacterium]|nr:MBL fold metallo-hydrolase [Verrucomicrobiae bacterium]